MNNLSIILTRAKEELEATFNYDTTLDIEEQGFTIEELDKTYKLFFTHNDNKTILSIEQDAQELYTKEFNANETMADLLKQLDKDIIIYTAVESIEEGWQSELTCGGSIIDFKDYKEYLADIQRITKGLGIEAEIQATFMGLEYQYKNR